MVGLAGAAEACASLPIRMVTERDSSAGTAPGAASPTAPLVPTVPLVVWIDATRPGVRRPVFGMPLLERQLRAVRAAGLRPARVWVETGPGVSVDEAIPRDLAAELCLEVGKGEGALAGRLLAAVRRGERLLALEGDAVADPRLLAHLVAADGPDVEAGRSAGAGARLARVARAGAGAERTAVLLLHGPLPTEPAGELAAADSLEALADAALAAGIAAELPLAEAPDYLPRLRRHLPAYAFRLSDDAARDAAERFLFQANYKGSTDFLTRWVYPPLVWALVRPLARRRVHPNWVSGANVVLALGAVPLFAAGAWVPGLACAWIMSLLDSVDGKLARLTFTASRLGHVLDHGLDVVHPPLWYLAWAWALAGGVAGAPVVAAAWGMTGLYIADRLVTEAFTRLTGRSIHAWTALDVQVRSFVSRRNVNLPLFTGGLLLGAAVPAFYAIVAWQGATLVFHAVRLGQAAMGQLLRRVGRAAAAG